jgi:hypothetical protein
MGSNRHDGWLRFCAMHEELLAATGLPHAITHGEHRWRDLLRDGSASGRGVSASLVDLSAPQWDALKQFAQVFFSEFESYAPLELFPAFRREAERRKESKAEQSVVQDKPRK